MKRTISLLLSLVIVFSLVCVAAPSVSAASAMKTSEQCVALLKSFEGFAAEPYPDNGNYTVGFGTVVSGKDLEKYQQNGITEAEADKLMRERLAGFETAVNQFVDKHSLKLSQNQFDALICFTYNLGTDWMTKTGYTFTQAIINGATGNDLIYAFAQWCKAGGAIYKSLIERRLCEANMYLNNVYSKTVPIHFRYVIFNANDETVTPSISVQGYDSSKTADIKATVSKSGYDFVGWYTAAEGGSAVAKLNYKTAVNTLYAHWQKAGGEVDAEGKIVGVPAEYTCYAATEASRKVYDAPGGEETKTIKGTDKLSIVAEHLDSNGNKWGKLSTGGWINVSAGIDNTPVVEDPESVIDPITVTVTTSGVNNRTGPGTNYAKQGKFDKGQQLVLTAVQKGGIYKWGKSEYGWIALQYTDYDSVILQGSEDAKKVTAVGTIIKADVLNVRSGPGVHNSKVDVYYRNDSVKITLRQKVGNTTWGLTEKGWISLYYVKLTEVKDGEVPDIDISGGSGDSTTTPGGSTGTGTGTGSNGTTVIATGKIINCNSVRIRAGAGTNTACIGSYANGTYVSFYETVKLKSDVWGRTDKGWVCLRYVALDAPTTGEGVTGRIINCTNLNVRAAAGTAYAKVAKLSKGTKVEILEYVKVGNAIWGRISQGWIHLYYVKLDAPLTNLDKKDEVDTETDVNTGTGTGESTGTGSGESTGTGSGESTGTGSGESTGTGSGESTGTGSGESTGTGSDEGTDDKEDKTPGADVDTSIEVTFKGTITADPSMKIRAAAGTQYGEVGTYKKGNRVTILEITAVGKSTWGRTDKGWISLFYVKPDGDTNVEGVVVKTITASSLKIRKEPASNAEVVGSYYTNNLVVVFLQIQNTETKEVWGLTENGWINMKYTK